MFSPPSSGPDPLALSKTFNLPRCPRDSSSFWIWFSRRNMATANANAARSCTLGGIMTLSSPIKPSGVLQSLFGGAAAGRTHGSEGNNRAAECRCMAPLLLLIINAEYSWFGYFIKSLPTRRLDRGPGGCSGGGTWLPRLPPPRTEHRSVRRDVLTSTGALHTVSGRQAPGRISSPPHCRGFSFVGAVTVRAKRTVNKLSWTCPEEVAVSRSEIRTVRGHAGEEVRRRSCLISL